MHDNNIDAIKFGHQNGFDLRQSRIVCFFTKEETQYPYVFYYQKTNGTFNIIMSRQGVTRTAEFEAVWERDIHPAIWEYLREITKRLRDEIRGKLRTSMPPAERKVDTAIELEEYAKLMDRVEFQTIHPDLLEGSIELESGITACLEYAHTEKGECLVTVQAENTSRSAWLYASTKPDLEHKSFMLDPSTSEAIVEIAERLTDLIQDEAALAAAQKPTPSPKGPNPPK